MTETPKTPKTDADVVRSFVSLHGRSAVMVLVGGAASAIGILLPVVQVESYAGSTSVSLMQVWFGPLLLILTVALACLPVFFKSYMRYALLAFGITSGLFAVVLVELAAVPQINGGAFTLAFGFFLTLIGNGAMAFGYYRIIEASLKKAVPLSVA